MLGIFGDSRRRARPRGPVMGLGATVPSSCWDKPGFKECNAQGWVVAERKCIAEGLANKEYGGDWEKCKSVVAADYAYYGCALRICPPPPPVRPTSSGGWTWKNTTPNQSVLAFQQHLNTCLGRNGYKPITADGKLGPATCGAFKVIGGECPDLFANDPIGNIGICQAFTNPTKVGSSTPVKDPVSDEAKKLDKEFGGLPWLKQDARAPALQATLNNQLVAHDFLPNTASGQLDAPMCGAMRYLDQNTGSNWMASWGQNCGAFTAPRPAPIPDAPVGPLPPAPVPPGPVGPAPGPAPAPAKLSTASMVAGGLALAAGIGGYLLYKKQMAGA